MLNKELIGDKNKDDAHLWTALCKGKREALDQLFRLYYTSLYDYGIKLISDKELVQDGIQKLFLKLWKRHTSLSQAKSIEVYLLFSLRRILFQQLESRKIRAKYNRTYLDERFAISFSAEEVIINLEFENEKKTKLLQTINLLNNRQKETLLLRYYHGLTNSEIAEVMDINRQSVRNNLSRAIKSLKSIIHASLLQ